MKSADGILLAALLPKSATSNSGIRVTTSQETSVHYAVLVLSVMHAACIHSLPAFAVLAQSLATFVNGYHSKRVTDLYAVH